MNNYNNHLNNNNYNIYINHLNNNLIYMNYGFQAVAEEAIASVSVAIESVASASSTFEKFNIDVVVVDTTLPSESSESSASSASSHVCQEKDTSCSICLVCLDAEQEEEKEIVEIVRTNCGHVFHSKCLAKWVPHNTTCPMCRQSIIKKSIIKK